MSNFAPTIAVATASFLAWWARAAHGAGEAALPTLAMPSTFGTTTGRPWLVPLFDLPVWARWAAIVPALMVCCFCAFYNLILPIRCGTDLMACFVAPVVRLQFFFSLTRILP